MAYTVRLRPEAVDDVDRALAYYASIRIELLVQLQAEFDNFFDSVGERPLSFQVHAGAIRRVFMERFPYGIYYVVDETVVTVLAVFHFADDPGKLEQRLEEGAG